MANLWLRIKIWTKVTLALAVLIYVIIFVANNSAKPVTPWFWFHHEPQTTLLVLVLCAFAAGAVFTVLLRTTIVTVRQVRELQSRTRTDRLDRELADMKVKAAMLRSKPEPAADPSTSTPTSGETSV